MRVWPALIALLISTAAEAAPPKLPYEFDPSVAANPSGTQQLVAEGEAALPLLPVATLAEVQLGNVKLWMWPESLTLMGAAAASGTTPMAWASPPSMCAKHAAFSVPPVDANASGACNDVRAEILREIGSLSACADVEQPERYVTTYEPAKVDLNVTGTLEGLIGLAGEALSHHSIPDGVLPPKFRETLRAILVKLRGPKLTASIAAARGAYGRARALATGNGACFSAGVAAALASNLDALQGELDAAAAHIALLESEGRVATDHESVCLAAKARARRSLPLPSLTRSEREFVSYYLGGTYWRMRGGGVMPLGSTQAARLYFLQQPFARIGELTGASDGTDAAFQIYLGVFEGWGEWQDMGTTPNEGDKYFDLAGMTNRGHRQVKAAVELLAQRSYDPTPLQTGGLSMGPCYFYSAERLYDFKYAHEVSPPYGDFILGFTTSGEFCSGASIALGLARTLLDGTPTGKPPSVDLCANRECGDDGCGGSCGRCAEGLTCTAGLCTEETPAAAPTPASSPPAPGPVAAPVVRDPSARDASPDEGGGGCGCSHARGEGETVWAVLLVALIHLARRRVRGPTP